MAPTTAKADHRDAAETYVPDLVLLKTSTMVVSPHAVTQHMIILEVRIHTAENASAISVNTMERVVYIAIQRQIVCQARAKINIV